MLTVILGIISVLLMLFAIASIIVPLLPGGVLLAWLGLFIFAIGTGFEKISLFTTIVFLILTLLIMVFNFFLPMIGAGKLKASKWGLGGAMLGSVAGIPVWGIWGVIIGPFIGTVIGELIAKRRTGQSLKIGLGVVISIIIGGFVNIVFILVMLGVLASSWF
jgi:uncharacterized protein